MLIPTIMEITTQTKALIEKSDLLTNGWNALIGSLLCLDGLVESSGSNNRNNFVNRDIAIFSLNQKISYNVDCDYHCSCPNHQLA